MNENLHLLFTLVRHIAKLNPPTTHDLGTLFGTRLVETGSDAETRVHRAEVQHPAVGEVALRLARNGSGGPVILRVNDALNVRQNDVEAHFGQSTSTHISPITETSPIGQYTEVYRVDERKLHATFDNKLLRLRTLSILTTGFASDDITLDRYAVAAKMADEIEAEMKRIAIWQTEPLPKEKQVVTTAFGIGSISFEQWLQFVFLSRVREIIGTRGAFPPSSSVSVQAYREWVMYGSGGTTDKLLKKLREFDTMIEFRPVVQRFGLFESDGTVDCVKNRNFTSRFNRAEARYIAWQVNLGHVGLTADLPLQFVAAYMRPDGSALARRVLHTKVLAKWNTSFHFGQWGWAEAGHWPQGNFHVELSLWQEPLCTAAFEICTEDDCG